jgi:excisionase family DNA binding protein
MGETSTAVHGNGGGLAEIPTGPPSEFLTAQEAAELLSLPLSFIRAKTRQEEMPYVPFGRWRRYRRESVLRWAESLERGGQS